MLRSFDTSLALSDDGREVLGCVVPFGQVARIHERTLDGTVDEYEEEFAPGCTARIRQDAARARNGWPSWVRFTLDHERSLDHQIGFCTSLVETEAGAFGTFKLHADPYRLDKIRSMLEESHSGLSVEFTDIARHPDTGPLRVRRQIQLAAVSATPIPVYADARVLAVRAEDVELVPASTPNLDAVRALLARVQ
jgi:HK97 family phage prohead protease